MLLGLDATIAQLILGGFDPLDLLGLIEQFFQQHSFVISLILIVPTIAFLIYERERTLRERSEEQRHQYLVDIERRRLSERNLDVQANGRLYHRHEPDGAGVGAPTKPYVVAHVDLHNIGDGPIDLLACLVSSRELDDGRIPGLATQARDVAWNDLVPYTWDIDVARASGSSDLTPLFRGISTTKNITYAPEQLVRLDPKQHEELIRIDALTNLDELYTRGHVNLEYKIFTVALGYTLVDIRGRDSKTELLRLYALDLARPHYHRWASIERALDTVNRFTFRLALRGLQQQENREAAAAHRPAVNYWADDPLGRLAHAAAWRCFLLYHWEFIERGHPATPAGAPDPHAADREHMDAIDAVKEQVKTRYGVYEQQDAPDYAQRLAAAGAHCLSRLDPLIQSWKQLNTTIDRCTTGSLSFADLVTKDADARQRWEALEHEGYLMTNVRSKDLQRLTKLLEADPEGLLSVERYSMRTKYVLVTIKAPGHDQNRAARVVHMP